MLRRAKRLQSTFDEYCLKYGHPQFALNQEDWRQIDYLLYLTRPFFDFTTALSQTKDATVHSVFGIYNKLFDHLEVSIRQLQRKRVPWKQAILSALYAAKEKLSEYYGKTTDIHGNLYAMGTILAPQYKLQFFSDKGWADNDFEWREKYLEGLQDYLKPYKERLSNTHSSSRTPSSATQRSKLDSLLARPQGHRTGAESGQQDELTQYLNSGKTCISLFIFILTDFILGTAEVDPLTFWKEHEQQYPVLASLARDVLSIPATGAGVERLFNSARDICHYRRGSLHATTIQDLMMFMCTTRFDIEDKQLAFIKDFQTKEEIEIAREETDAQQPQEEFLDLISDDEEDDLPSDQPEITMQPTSSKRRQSTSSSDAEQGNEGDPESHIESDDDEAELPLPHLSHKGGNAQIRTSGRPRKRSRLLEGYTVSFC